MSEIHLLALAMTTLKLHNRTYAQNMISVIIPAYNEEDSIGACLASLVTQKTDKKFEVIFVDNNSKDKTIEIAKQYKDKLNLKIIKEKTQGRGAARARGFDEAKGDIMFSSDADAVFFPEWIELFSSYFADKKVIAVTGSVKITDNTKINNWIFNSLHPYLMRGYRLIFGHYWLSGFSFAVRSTTYNEVGGLNRNLNALDDIDLGFRIYKKGKISLVDNPRVTMSGRRFKPHFFRGLFSYFKPFFQLVFLKNHSFTVSDER